MKRTPLKRSSKPMRKRAKSKGKPWTELPFQDRRGIPWEMRHTLLPTQTASWPVYPPRRAIDTSYLQAEFHAEFRFQQCWLCGHKHDDVFPLELHHLAAGSRGRSHERELFTMLCRLCHADVDADDLPKLLYAKWTFDRMWCDWEFLMVRHGNFFAFELTKPDWMN